MRRLQLSFLCVIALFCLATLAQNTVPAPATAQVRTVMETSLTAARPLVLKSGVVDGDLGVSLNQAGVPDEVALDMVRELAQAFNIEQAVQSGDRFMLLFEQQKRQQMQAWQNPRAVGVLPLIPGTAKLLAFQFKAAGKNYEAYWYDQGNQSGYYFTDGISLRPAFLRTPIELVRVSSGFGTRLHPIKKDWRNHEGIDFAAPTGTRIFAAGDGVVEFAGTQGGYGRMVKIKHANNTQTVYAHLSLFAEKLAVGNLVKQGEVIGFVGQTGWATGPHLHYEYRVDNRPIDPFSVELPVTNRVTTDKLVGFKEQVDLLKAKFNALNPDVNQPLSYSLPNPTSD